jgi:hypothetical protein
MQGEDGCEEECIMCGDGGFLALCESCSRTTCRNCISRNFGESAWDNMESFTCYVCDSRPISTFRIMHKLEMEVRETCGDKLAS